MEKLKAGDRQLKQKAKKKRYETTLAETRGDERRVRPASADAKRKKRQKGDKRSQAGFGLPFPTSGQRARTNSGPCLSREKEDWTQDFRRTRNSAFAWGLRRARFPMSKKKGSEPKG